MRMNFSMDYENTMAKSLILCSPNSNPNSQKNIWDMDIKFFVEIMDKGLTVPK